MSCRLHIWASLFSQWIHCPNWESRFWKFDVTCFWSGQLESDLKCSNLSCGTGAVKTTHFDESALFFDCFWGLGALSCTWWQETRITCWLHCTERQRPFECLSMQIRSFVMIQKWMQCWREVPPKILQSNLLCARVNDDSACMIVVTKLCDDRLLSRLHKTELTRTCPAHALLCQQGQMSGRQIRHVPIADHRLTMSHWIQSERPHQWSALTLPTPGCEWKESHLWAPWVLHKLSEFQCNCVCCMSLTKWETESWTQMFKLFSVFASCGHFQQPIMHVPSHSMFLQNGCTPWLWLLPLSTLLSGLKFPPKLNHLSAWCFWKKLSPVGCEAQKRLLSRCYCVSTVKRFTETLQILKSLRGVNLDG